MLEGLFHIFVLRFITKVRRENMFLITITFTTIIVVITAVKTGFATYSITLVGMFRRRRLGDASFALMGSCGEFCLDIRVVTKWLVLTNATLLG